MEDKKMELEQEVKNECISRMKDLNLAYQCINAFKSGKIWLSESYGALYELREKEQEIVNKFEKENKGCKVYHIIHNNTEFGELYSLLYVGNNKEEWKFDKEDMENDVVFAYVYNNTDDMMSEFGTIGIKRQYGGLVRTY